MRVAHAVMLAGAGDAPSPEAWATGRHGVGRERGLVSVGRDPPGTPPGASASADGGESWKPAGASLPKMVFAFAFPPGKTGTVVAGTTEGVFSSTDGGARWALLGGKPVHDDVRHLAFDRGTQVRLYAGTAGGSVYALAMEDGK